MLLNTFISNVNNSQEGASSHFMIFLFLLEEANIIKINENIFSK